MKSQCEIIEGILKRDGQIDNFHAIETRLTLRLGARILDLKNKGYEFETEMVGKNCVYKVVQYPKAKQLQLSY
jgi:hypothetical protein